MLYLGMLASFYIWKFKKYTISHDVRDTPKINNLFKDMYIFKQHSKFICKIWIVTGK